MFYLHDDARRKIERIATRLYSERRMSADEMRDTAQTLTGVLAALIEIVQGGGILPDVGRRIHHRDLIDPIRPLSAASENNREQLARTDWSFAPLDEDEQLSQPPPYEADPRD